MKRIAKFEKISQKQFLKDFKDIYKDWYIGEEITDIYDRIILPKRATIGSAGYDIRVPFECTVRKGDVVKIPTGIRCKMNSNYVMLIFPRSSLGIKRGLKIANTIPVIDSDYYYADNEGHIFICIQNDKKEPLFLNKGEAIVQAVFLPYGISEEETVVKQRSGGIGSTGE